MKVVAPIQARMNSSRLPGKAMMPLCGKPMIEVLLERILKSRRIDEVILATSTNASDDILEETGDILGIKVYRGSEEDVLERLGNQQKRKGIKPGKTGSPKGL